MKNYSIRVKEGFKKEAFTLHLKNVHSSKLKQAVFQKLSERDDGFGRVFGTFVVVDAESKQSVERGRYNFDGILQTRPTAGGIRFKDGRRVNDLLDL